MCLVANIKVDRLPSTYIYTYLVRNLLSHAGKNTLRGQLSCIKVLACPHQIFVSCSVSFVLDIFQKRVSFRTLIQGVNLIYWKW